LIDTKTLIYLEADKDLTPQLEQLEEQLNENRDAQLETIQQTICFECLKQTKVGQVVAGLYRLSPS
jgi:16S rRNA (guanine966-N2)-methyltransferase